MGSMWPWCGLRPRHDIARPKLTLLAHEGFPFPAALRRAVLAAMNAASTSTAELARLNWRLGLAYAEAVRRRRERHRVKLDLIGCHGQTLYHQARADVYAGRSLPAHGRRARRGHCCGDRRSGGLEFPPGGYVGGRPGRAAGSAARLCAVCGCKRGRVLQNIGGIANLTAIPAGAAAGGGDRLRHRPGQHGDRLRWRRSCSASHSTAMEHSRRGVQCLSRC